MSVRHTQSSTNMMGAGESTAYATHVEARNMARTNGARRRATVVYANIMATTPGNGGQPEFERANKFSTVWANFMIPFTPDFGFIHMFKNEVFPHDISYNSISATRFDTTVSVVDSGYDQRNARWIQPLMEFDIAYGVRTMEHLHDLIVFFRAMQGRRHAFLYKDYTDYTSTLATREEARKPPPIGHNDQLQFIADHKKYQFQLTKLYRTKNGVVEHHRPIYKPMPGTVKISVNGIEVFNVNIDHNTGKVTFVTDLEKINLQAMSIAPEVGQPGLWRVSRATAWTTGFLAGDKIVMAGWLNAANNNTLVRDISIVTVQPNYLVIQPSYDNFGENETNRNGVYIQRHPAPRALQEVRAGFHFYIPVRFDTDRLPTSIEHYGIGSAADIKLVEVRPSEENLEP